MPANEPLILAVPKGRILKELSPLMARVGLEPEAAFGDDDARQLRFSTNHPGLDIIRVRSFDVATFVAFGAAHLGVAGNDVLMEFDYPELYAPVDLKIGHCRLSVAAPWIVLAILATRGGAIEAYDSRLGVMVLLVGAGLCIGAYRLMMHIGRLPEERRVLR